MEVSDVNQDRYMVWIAVFEHFLTIDETEMVPRQKVNALWESLNTLWQDERKNASPEALTAYAGALAAARRLKH
jgi:hypothetical protein